MIDENGIADHENEPERDPLEEMFSLDDLSAAYARAIAESGDSSGVNEPAANTDSNDKYVADPLPPNEEPVVGIRSLEADEGVNPLMIVEAALFVGHPNNTPITAATIAGTMRGVSAEEVDQLIAELNESYRLSGHALEIFVEEKGYRMGVRSALRGAKNAFYGKVRETRLNQPSIDVLSLVVYQPGITLAAINDQRGKDSGAIVNQLVRRELLEVKREGPPATRAPSTFYPTIRLLNLLGIESLEDLPMVDDADVCPVS